MKGEKTSYQGREVLLDVLQDSDILHEGDLRKLFFEDVYDREEDVEKGYFINEDAQEKLKEEDREALKDPEEIDNTELNSMGEIIRNRKFKFIPQEVAENYKFSYRNVIRNVVKGDNGNKEEEFERFKENVEEDNSIVRMKGGEKYPDGYRQIYSVIDVIPVPTPEELNE